MPRIGGEDWLEMLQALVTPRTSVPIEDRPFIIIGDERRKERPGGRAS
jgi:hypothetical protein